MMIPIYIELITDILNEIINAIVAAVQKKAFWIVMGIIAAILVVLWLNSGMEFWDFFSIHHAKEVFSSGEEAPADDGSGATVEQSRNMPEP